MQEGAAVLKVQIMIMCYSLRTELQIANILIDST